MKKIIIVCLLIFQVLYLMGCEQKKKVKVIGGVVCIQTVYNNDLYHHPDNLCPACGEYVLTQYCGDCGVKINVPVYSWVCKQCSRRAGWRTVKICTKCGSREFKWVGKIRT